ncbi:hypothetical protein JCM33374_g1055 [Metschnikowia sp. JCM 33374]|nr:hypothetical protein JCM33374_g1055 [Metschnikowia sp. JCM 33374]
MRLPPPVICGPDNFLQAMDDSGTSWSSKPTILKVAFACALFIFLVSLFCFFSSFAQDWPRIADVRTRKTNLDRIDSQYNKKLDKRMDNMKKALKKANLPELEDFASKNTITVTDSRDPSKHKQSCCDAIANWAKRECGELTVLENQNGDPIPLIVTGTGIVDTIVAIFQEDFYAVTSERIKDVRKEKSIPFSRGRLAKQWKRFCHRMAKCRIAVFYLAVVSLISLIALDKKMTRT